MQCHCLEPAVMLRASLSRWVQSESGKLDGHKRGGCSHPGKGLLSAIPEQFKCRFRNRLLRKGYRNVVGCPWVRCLHMGQLPWAPLAVSRDSVAAACGAQGMVNLLLKTASRIVPCVEFKQGCFFTAGSFLSHEGTSSPPMLVCFSRVSNRLHRLPPSITWQSPSSPLQYKCTNT